LTFGNAQDELTHPFSILMQLARLGREHPVERVVAASFGRVPFVPREAQERAKELDPSVPSDPTSHSLISVAVDDAVLHTRSRFMAMRKHRWVEVVLGTVLREPQLLAEIRFDEDGHDILCLREIAGGDDIVERFPATNRIHDEVGAFFDHILHNNIDPRTTDLAAAGSLVRLLDHAMQMAENQN